MSNELPNAIIYIVIIGILVSYMLNARGTKFLTHLKNLAIWFIILTAFLIIHYYKDNIYNFYYNLIYPEKMVIEEEKDYSVAEKFDGKSITYKKAPDGHFHISALINGINIEFLVDTGASDVVLTLNDAIKVGLDLKSLEFHKKYITANGMVDASVTAVNMCISDYCLESFPVSIMMHDSGKSLLGMSYLSRFASMKFDGDTLTLSY